MPLKRFPFEAIDPYQLSLDMDSCASIPTLIPIKESHFIWEKDERRWKEEKNPGLKRVNPCFFIVSKFLKLSMIRHNHTVKTIRQPFRLC